MRYYLIFFFIIITNILDAQVMLPAYQGVQYKNLNTSVHAINDRYGGGIIIYILVSGDPGYDPAVQHGLIAASVDQGTVRFAGTTIYATTYNTLGTGNANTNSLVAAGGASAYAASLCYNYSVVGTDGITYSDWYLPSKDELNKLYLYNNSFGGLTTSNYYWSSSLYISGGGSTNLGIWAQLFSSGSLRRAIPGTSYYVRAMRSF